MKKKVLITGAGGYIGSVATYLFLQKGYCVIALDNFSTGFRDPLRLLQRKFGASRLKIYKKDICDRLTSLFQKERGIDTVLHYAASCSVNESMENPHKYFLNNAFGTLNLLEHMAQAKVRRIIFSSTCAVYGEAQYVPVDEKHPLNPSNPYGASKRMAEEMIQWYGQQNDFHYVILRYFNVCGASPDGLIGDSKKPSELLVQNAVRGALGIEPFRLTCPRVSTPDTTPIRDYINVFDLAEAHLLACQYLQSEEKSNILNIGTGTGYSVREVIEKIQNITGNTFSVSRGSARKGEYAIMKASIAKARKILGWEPKTSLHQTVQSLVKWYSHHPYGWKQ